MENFVYDEYLFFENGFSKTKFPSLSYIQILGSLIVLSTSFKLNDILSALFPLLSSSTTTLFKVASSFKTLILTVLSISTTVLSDIITFCNFKDSYPALFGATKLTLYLSISSSSIFDTSYSFLFITTFSTSI